MLPTAARFEKTGEDFHSFFITAASWGTFSQSVSDGQQKVTLTLRWGELSPARLELDIAPGVQPENIEVSVPATTEKIDGRLIISGAEVAKLNAGDVIKVRIR